MGTARSSIAQTLLIAGLFIAQSAGAQSRGIDILSSPESSRRIALVVGNNSYPAKPLENAVNDADSMERALSDVGFNPVLKVTDTDLSKLQEAVAAFVESIKPGDTALFFYAGHGIQIDGRNYLLPVDFKAQSQTLAKQRSIDVDNLLGDLTRQGAKVNIIILDACRDNPYVNAGRSTAGGLAPVSQAAGTFIAFATAPGKTASDNRMERNGLFTGALLKQMEQPGLSINDLFDRVREHVARESNRRQIPFTVTGILGTFMFRPPAVNATQVVLPTSGPPPEAWEIRVSGRDRQRYVWVPGGAAVVRCLPIDDCTPDERRVGRQVRWAHGTWIGERRVSVGAYSDYLTEADTVPAGSVGSDQTVPVTGISIEEARAYCRWAGGDLPFEWLERWAVSQGYGLKPAKLDQVVRSVAKSDPSDGWEWVQAGVPILGGSVAGRSADGGDSGWVLRHGTERDQVLDRRRLWPPLGDAEIGFRCTLRRISP